MRHSPVPGVPLLALMLVASTQVHATPTPEWQVDFASTGRMPIGPDEKPQLQRDRENGAVYLHNTGSWPLPPLAAKIDMSGMSEWSVLERSTTYTYPQRLAILADGSVITSHDNVVRYSANGSMLWSAPEAVANPEVATVVEVGGDILVFLNEPNTVTRVDRDTGIPVERLAASALGSCPGGMAVGQGSDTVYWVQGCGGAHTLSRLLLAPLRIDWSVELPATGFAARAAIVADEGGVQAAFGDGSASRVSRFAADGSLLWSVAGAQGDTPGIALDADGDPLVFGESVVEKLDRATGARRWLHAVSGDVVDVDVTADAIVVAGNTDAAGSAGFVERLRGTDGVSQWQSTLASPASEWMKVTSVAVHGDRVLAAGVACAVNAQPERCDLMLWPREIDGAETGSMVPTFALPASGRAVAASSDTTVGAALGYGPLGMQLRVKRVRNADGVVLWDVTRPVALPNAPGKLPFPLDLAVTDGGVAVFYARPFSQGSLPHSSEAMIAAFDAATGAFRWERSVLDLGGAYTDGRALYFGIDSAGNVLASSNEGVVPEDFAPITQTRRQIRKYAATTGQEIQQIDFAVDPSPNLMLYEGPMFRVVDGDILTEEKPLPSTDYALTRINGGTGTVLWSNATLPYPYPFGMSALGAGRAYVAISDTEVSVMAIDMAAGTASWVTPYSHPSDIGYGVWASYRGSDGAVYAGGYRKIPRPGGSPTSWDSRGLLMRVDGTNGALGWVNRFDTSPVVSPSGQLLPVLDHDGVLYSWQRQARGVESPGYFYTGISITDGALRGTQVVYLGTTPFPHLGPSVSSIEVLGAASDGGTVVHGGFGDASQPLSFAIAKWPAPQPFAGGSLRLSLVASVQSVDGETATSFVVEAVNDGAIDAPAVDVLLTIPSESMVGPITCAVGSVPCMAKRTPDSIGHRLDLPVGARVRLSGMVRHRTLTIGRFEASAFSPYGFVEMDMKDNIRSLRVDDILFSHGFD
jgi:outer membrane protein assembly factor BamB